MKNNYNNTKEEELELLERESLRLKKGQLIVSEKEFRKGTE